LNRISPEVEIIHVDTCERHSPLDEASICRADFLNHRRFLFDELLLGRVTENHPLNAFLTGNGFPEGELDWFRARPVKFNARGLDYYKINEEELKQGVTYNAPSLRPLGFARVAMEYFNRLGLPLRLTETNIQGLFTDRITWLKYMRGQYEELRRWLPAGYLRGFDWYPLFDCRGWLSLLQAGNWPWDPQGIFWCDERGRRHESELSVWYARLAGGARADDLPAYRFQPHLERELRGFLPQMSWEWREAG
jgi:hypothetical protein